MPDPRARKLGEEIARLDRRQKIAITDTEDLDRDILGVDGNDRDALLADARQDIVLAGEVHLRRAIADIDVVVRRAQERFAHGGRKALTQRDGIMFAVLQALDADLLLFGRDCGRLDACDADEGGKIDASRRQRLGKLETDARRGRILVDLVIENTEAISLAFLGVGRADGGDIDKVETRLVSIQRQAPELALGEEIANLRERGRLFGLGRGLLIGKIGGCRRGLVDIVGIARRAHRAGIGKPSGRVLRTDGDQSGQRFECGIGIAFRSRRLRILA